MAVSQYLFHNEPQAAQRFAGLEAVHDPTTVRHLEALGVREGWGCWEVGGGGGSIASWLAERVGPGGHVLVTDIDPRYLAALETLGHTNLQVQRHDVGRDPLPPEPFDLIHARLVLIHVPTAEQALLQLVQALKPGGCLLVEDFDRRLLDRTFPTTDAGAAAVFARVYAAMVELLELHGNPPDWGRGLYQRLCAAGLVDVGMEGFLAIRTGGSAGARVDRANFEQVQAEALERGLLTQPEIDEVIRLLADPTFAVTSPVMFSAWGRRPVR